MAKSRRHEICIVLKTDKPCTRSEAVAFAKDCIHGEFYPTDPKGEVETMTIRSFKARMSQD